MKIRSSSLLPGIIALALASPDLAVAQQFDMTPTGSDPNHDRRFDNGSPCSIGTNMFQRPYTAKTISVSVAGSYQLRDTGVGDGGFAIYSGPYDPASPAVGCLASFDSIQNVTLTPGNYTLVGGMWANHNLTPFRVTFTGPAPVTLVSPIPVPSLSEWAMILMGLALAGGAALTIQRRRVNA
jgi:hypothetical protein